MTDLLTNHLTIEDVEAAIRHEDKRGRTSHLYRQLLATMQREAKLRLFIERLPDQTQWEELGYANYYDWVCEGVRQCNEYMGGKK